MSHSAPLRVVCGLANGSCTPIYKLSTYLMPTMMTAGRSWSRAPVTVNPDESALAKVTIDCTFGSAKA